MLKCHTSKLMCQSYNLLAECILDVFVSEVNRQLHDNFPQSIDVEAAILEVPVAWQHEANLLREALEVRDHATLSVKGNAYKEVGQASSFYSRTREEPVLPLAALAFINALTTGKTSLT